MYMYLYICNEARQHICYYPPFLFCFCETEHCTEGVLGHRLAAAFFGDDGPPVHGSSVLIPAQLMPLHTDGADRALIHVSYN